MGSLQLVVRRFDREVPIRAYNERQCVLAKVYLVTWAKIHDRNPTEMTSDAFHALPCTHRVQSHHAFP